MDKLKYLLRILSIIFLLFGLYIGYQTIPAVLKPTHPSKGQAYPISKEEYYWYAEVISKYYLPEVKENSLSSRLKFFKDELQEFRVDETEIKIKSDSVIINNSSNAVITYSLFKDDPIKVKVSIEQAGKHEEKIIKN